MLEKLEIGRQYNNGIGITVKVVAMGREVVVAENAEKDEYVVGMEYALSNWSELPKPKKRFWLWDVKTNEKSHIVKSAAYMDDEGRASNGCTIYNKDMLIKKHESEFIEVYS